MEAKKIKEEAAATVDAEAMEQDGENEIERKLKLMEGGGNKTVNGPLIPLRSAVASAKKSPSSQPEETAPITNSPLSNVCGDCGRVFNSSEGLKKHSAISHVTASPLIAESASFPCEVCNLRFDDAQSAVRHSAAVHIADPRKRLVVCDLCLRVFPNSFQMRVHRRVYHIPMRCKSCRIFYTRSGERMTRHEAKCEAAASAAMAAKRRHFQAPEDAAGGEVSVQKGRAMPADEDYGETVQELNAAKAAAAATEGEGGAPGFKCAECSFAHTSFAAVFSHTASAHALRFRAVTSDLRVAVRKADVEAANAQLARDMAERSRQRRFMCRVCNFEDVTMPALKAHLKTHTVAEKLAAKKKIRQQAEQQNAVRIKTEILEPPTPISDPVDAVEHQVQEKEPEVRPEPPQTDAGKKLIQVSAAKPRIEERPKSDAPAEEPAATDPEIVFRCNKCSFKASNVVDIKKHKGEAHPKKAKKAKKSGGDDKSEKRSGVKTIKFAARKKVASEKQINNIKKEVITPDEAPTDSPPPQTEVASALPPPPRPPPPIQQKDPPAASAPGAPCATAKGAKEPTLYRCKICLFRAPTANEVKIHLRQAHPNRKALLRTLNGANSLKSGPGLGTAVVKREPGAPAATAKVMNCGRCEFSTVSLPELKQHVLNVHPTPERQEVTKCHVCGHQPATSVALQQHSKSAHLDPATGVYACRLCTFSSSYFKSLNKHAETYVHENQDPLRTSGDPLATSTDETDPLSLHSAPSAAKRIKMQC